MNENNNIPSEKSQSWQFTSTELKKALDTWGDLTAQNQRLSVDEQMIQDMQKLLRDLQVKLKELSATPSDENKR